MSACKRCSANPSCKEPQSKWFGRVKRCKILRVSLFPIREPSQSSSQRHSRPAVCAASEEALCYWCSNLYIRLGYTLSFTVSKHSKLGFHWVSCCWKKGPFRAPWCSYPDENTRDLCSYGSIYLMWLYSSHFINHNVILQNSMVLYNITVLCKMRPVSLEFSVLPRDTLTCGGAAGLHTIKSISNGAAMNCLGAYIQLL